MRIVTVTPNPMLDKTLILPALVPGAINRATAISAGAGGKGNNVARQARLLGLEVFALNFLGGPTGVKVGSVLRAEHIPGASVTIAAETREGWTLRDGNAAATSVFEPSPNVIAAEVAALIDLVSRELHAGDWLVVSGTLPGGCPDTLYAELITLAHQRGASSLLDACGPALIAGLAARPTIAKPNRAEYARTFAKDLTAPDDMPQALEHLRECGATIAVITDGPRPWYAAATGGTWQIIPPAIREVNPIGSGDALAAALIAGTARNWPLPRTLQLAGAVAAANAAVWPVAAVSEADASARLNTIVVIPGKEKHTVTATKTLS